MATFQIVLTLILFTAMVIPVGRYLANVILERSTWADPVLDRLDRLLYRLTGVRDEPMTWKQYMLAILVSNGVMTVMGLVILKTQQWLLLNPNGTGTVENTLSVNTVISFITNTNLQDYSGESTLSHLSQMLVIIFMMFTSAGSGFAAAAAFMRGLSGAQVAPGNFYRDLIRVITRVLLPLSVAAGLFLVWQGVPQTLQGTQTVTTLEGTLQDIALGPVAALESIKHIGTNGGGFFGGNSAHPFENPTPLTNLAEILSMMLLPGALVLSFGHMLKNRKQGRVFFAAMAVLFVVMLPVALHGELAGNHAMVQAGLSPSYGNMEGKEVRFGITQSALFTTVTTAFTTGSVNNMHDSLTPLGGLTAMWNMMLNVVFGGKGVGFINMMMYAILSVFLCGLMVGRSPEIFRKRIEGREIRLIALAILIHPLLILGGTAVALRTGAGVAGITNPGFHGLSQVLYQFTTAAANNGSGFEGLADNTPFWNLSTALVMLLGRYIPLLALLGVSGSLAGKKEIPEGTGTFRTDTLLFGGILVSMVIIIGALTFLPALALGPVAEALTLGR